MLHAEEAQEVEIRQAVTTTKAQSPLLKGKGDHLDVEQQLVSGSHIHDDMIPLRVPMQQNILQTKKRTESHNRTAVAKRHDALSLVFPPSTITRSNNVQKAN
mmetsp:Transcript_57684/g.66334  ORF Transcript_57684/g.66334 Transcript_57684/m.66334 type:complete len:102 (-) Transcript_57684:24-329(-)